MIHLVLGGARSGKSSYAEKLAMESGKMVHYIATATGGDSEMQERIARHKAQRPAHWTLTEEPLAIAEYIRDYRQPAHLLLVDCLTLWLSNLLLHPSQPDLLEKQEELCLALSQCNADVILVGNEVGMGIVPMGEVNRRFTDHAGWLNQAVARTAQHVSFVVAGLPIELKNNGNNG